jgi:hypothetical protein
MRSKTLHFALLLLIAFGGCKARRAITADPTYDDPKGDIEDPAESEATLIVSGRASYNFGNQATLSTTEIELTLENEGPQTADNISLSNDIAAPFDFKGGSFPGAGGTCSTSLGASSTCSIFVEYTPTVEGTFSDTFTLDYESDGTAKAFSFGVFGSAGSSSLTVTGSPLYTFDNTLVGATTSHTFTIENEGDLTARFMQDADLLTAPYSYKGGVYPGTGGTCTATLEPTDTCTVVLDFTPTVAGASSGAWGLGYIDSSSPGAVSLLLAGSSGLADLEITDSPIYTFASTFVGATTDRTFTLTNNGDFEATDLQDEFALSAPYAYAGTGTFPGTGGTCTSTLAVGDDCTIVIRFEPTTTGTFTDTLELSYYNGEETLSIEVDFSGLGQGALLEITTGLSYSFGRVAKGTSGDRTLTIENVGNYTATAINDALAPVAPFYFKGYAFPGTGGSCASTLSAGATCTVVLMYWPTGSTTTLVSNTGSVQISYFDAANTQTLTVALEGEAGLGGLSISSGAWGTRAVGSTTNRSFTVTNNGTFAVTEMEAGAAFGAPFVWATSGVYPGTSGTCGTELPPSGTCTVRLNFMPTVVGASADTLSISFNNGSTTQSGTVALSGTGALAVLTITDFPSYDFGSVSYNQSNLSRTFTVTNTGGFAASSLSQSGLAAPFTRTGGTCGTSLAAGATCTHIVRFTPTAIGAAMDTMNISYNNGQTAGQILSIDVNGTGLNVAPVATAQSQSFVHDSVANSITLASTDPNGDSRTYELLTLPSNGTLSVGVGVLGSPTLTYTPDPAYSGADSFTFRVNDGLLDSPAATVTLTITP